MKLGEWQEGIDGLNESTIPQVIDNYASATMYDHNWYKAWHAFAYLNYEAVLFYKNQKSPHSNDPPMTSSIPMTPADIGSRSSVGAEDRENVRLSTVCKRFCLKAN